MSLEHVKSFYDRLTSDEDFRIQVQNANSQEEYSQIVQTAGFNFTEEELEDYTAQLLESAKTDEELQNLGEKELAGIFGGMGKPDLSNIPPRYGFLRRWPMVQPLYGVVIENPETL